MKHAEVTVPSLDDWEKQWKKNPQGIVKPAVVQVDFRGQQVMPATMPGCLLLQPVTVLDRRPMELPSGAWETRLRKKGQFRELVA